MNIIDYQRAVDKWVLATFGAEIASDKVERNHRFLEEALELVQANGCSKNDALRLVDYVYGRPVGEVAQEVGGVMVTLGALCNAIGADMKDAGKDELIRCWEKMEKIREKQRSKPKGGPLPGVGGGSVLGPAKLDGKILGVGPEDTKIDFTMQPSNSDLSVDDWVNIGIDKKYLTVEKN